MEAVNGVSDGDKGAPPPPSPLTGCYLLIVVGEPHCNDHRDIILQRVAKGLLSWDVNDCLVDLEKELAIITEQGLEGEEARYGERLIQFASENLVTEILIHPVVSTLAQCVRNLLSSFTRHRHIIHAGYTFANNGSWVLQDGTFSLADFSEAFQEIEVLRVIRAYENGISLDIHCAPEGDWNCLPKEAFTKSCKVRVNPNDVLTAGSPSIRTFINYLEPFLVPAEIENILESSEVVGNIRFSRPTLYVFPGGQGDAALFGINGFNMLLDGGFSRKACFWDFVRHLDRLDAILLTRLNNSNVNGISSVLRRKKQNALYPQIGHFFCNIQERKAILSPDGDKDKDPLLINLLDEGQEIVSNLRHLSLIPQVCYRDSEPINLYHKVGHGTLDMYVLSPAKDSKEVREFLHKWNNNDQKLFANPKNNKDFVFPLQNLVSICALLVWQPANPEDTITRILFPGSSPQNRIFEGLDRIRSLDCIKHPVCSEKSLAPATIIKTKHSILDKIISTEKKFPIDNKREKPTKLPTDNILDSEVKNGDMNGVQPEKVAAVKKSDSTESEKSVSKPKKIIENGDKTEKPKPKPKTDPKPKARSDSQQRKMKGVDKKPSPTTPKKHVEKINGELKPKPSPTATPAKSTKEANNRKVVESKIRAAPKKEPPKPPVEKKEVKSERKPISRRPKDVSKVSGSPAKKVNGVQKPDTISKRGKLDKEGTTDSSTVSTPSADQDSILKKDISKLTTDEIQNMKAQELADLKEEQEAIKEIEAVFRKGELQTDKPSDFRKIKDLSIDDKLESEEYLIIEKTEIVADAANEPNKEEETQKIARDSEESEKLRKLSDALPTESVEVKEKMEIQDEVQKIIVSAADIVKAKDEAVEASKEISATSPEDKVDVSTDKKDIDNDIKENAQESQPDEKGSANVESGATTTAPTLPEDERMPLDEIKEDNGDLEEKHVKEDTKEKDVPVIQLPPKTFENVAKLPPVVGIRLDKQSHIRDIVKTPDEVADLPVHEEVDIDHYQEYTSPTETKPGVEEAKKDEKEIDTKEALVEEKQQLESEAKVVVEKEIEEVDTEKDKLPEEIEKEADKTVPKEKTDVDDKKEETKDLSKEKVSDVGKEQVETVISEDLDKHELSKMPETTVKAEDKEDIKTPSQIEAITQDKDGEKVDVHDVDKNEKDVKLSSQVSEKIAEDTNKLVTKSVEEIVVPVNEKDVKLDDKEIKDGLTKQSDMEDNIQKIDIKKVEGTKSEEKSEEIPELNEEVVEKSETEVKEKDNLPVKEIKEEQKLTEQLQKLPDVPKEEITVAINAEEAKIEDVEVEEAKVEEAKVKEGKIEEVDVEEAIVGEGKVKEAEVEEAKVKEAKIEAAKVEEVKIEEAKVGEIKTIEVKVDEIEVEGAKVEKIKVHEAKIEAAKVEEVKIEEAKVGEIKTREVKADETEVEGAKVEKVKVHETKDEKDKDETVKIQETKVEEATDDKTKVEQAKVEEPKTEKDKVQETKVKEAKVDDTKDEKVKIQESEVEEAVVDKAKVEETKAEEIKAEKTKVEESKTEKTKVHENEVEETKVDETKDEKDKNEKAQIQEFKVEAAIVDKAKLEEAKVEEAKVEEAKVEEAKVEKTKVEDAKVEEAKVKEARVEEADAEETKTEKAEVQEIVVEEIKAEEVKVEETKADEVKVDKTETEKDTVEEIKETKTEEDTVEETNETISEQIDDKVQLAKEDVYTIHKIDEKLQELKDQEEEKHIKAISEVISHTTEQPQHAESVIITTDSLPESPLVDDKKFEEKIELGRKSPKEREEDVAKIVASVAEVLKSDAPLEEFEGKLPFQIPYQTFTTELRETHITTVESPVTDENKTIKSTEDVSPKASTTKLIEEERKIAPIHEEPEIAESKRSRMLKESSELMQATSKMINDIKQAQPTTESATNEELDADIPTVHRMLVTASSEDGGEETEICPVGTIIFSRSSESSGRSSPELQSQKVSQKSSIADTVSDVTVITKPAASDETANVIDDDTKKSVKEEVKDDKYSESVIDKTVCDKIETKDSSINNEILDNVDNEKQIKSDEEELKTKKADAAEDTEPKIESPVVLTHEDIKEITTADNNKEAQKDAAPEKVDDKQHSSVEKTEDHIVKDVAPKVEEGAKKNVAIDVSKATETVSQSEEKEAKQVTDNESSTTAAIGKEKDDKQEEHKVLLGDKHTETIGKVISAEEKKDQKDETTESIESQEKEDKSVVDKHEVKSEIEVKHQQINDVEDKTTKTEEMVEEKAQKGIEENIVKKLETLEGTVDDKSGEKLEEVSHVEETLPGATESFKESLRKDVEETIKHANETIHGLEERVYQKVEDAKEEVKEKTAFLGEIVNDIGATLVKDTSNIVDETKKGIEDIKDDSKSVIENLKEDVKKKEAALVHAVEDLKQSIQTAAEKSTDVSVVEEAIDDQKEQLLNTAEKFEEAVVKEKEKVQAGLKEAKNIVESKVDEIKKALVDQKETVVGVAADVKIAIAKDVEEKFEEIKKEVIDVKEKVQSKVEDVTKEIEDKISEKLVDAKQDVQSTTEGAKQDLDESKHILEEVKDSIVEQTTAEVKQLGEKIQSAIQDLKDEEEKIQKSITEETQNSEVAFKDNKVEVIDKVDGLKKDLGKMEDDLKDAIKNGASEIPFVKKDSTLTDSEKTGKDKGAEEHKYELFNGLESVEKMVVDVLTADKVDSDQKSDAEIKTHDHNNLSDIVEKIETEVEEIVEKGVAEVKELVEETKEVLSSLFRSDSPQEKVLEKSAHDIEENYETLSELSKSIIFEKFDKTTEEERKKQEQTLEKTAKTIEEEYEAVEDIAKTVAFEKYEPLTDEQKRERVLEKTAKDIEEAEKIVEDMAKSIVFEKCDKPISEEKEIETILEKSAKDIEETEKAVEEMAKSIEFEKCEKPLTEEKRIERILEQTARDVEENEKTVEDMAKSVLFEKCEKPLSDEQKQEIVLETAAHGIEENDKAVSDVTKSKDGEEIDEKQALAESQKEKEAKLENKTEVLAKEPIQDAHHLKSVEHVEIREDKESKFSGKSSPALSTDSKDLLKEGSGKSTPDIKDVDHLKTDNQDSLLSGKSSPGLSGKSSPVLSGRLSPNGKTESKDSLLSGKSSPEPTKPESKISSGNLSPTPSVEEKDKSLKSTPFASGKSSPVLQEEVTQPLQSTPGSRKASDAVTLDKELAICQKEVEVKEEDRDSKETPSKEKDEVEAKESLKIETSHEKKVSVSDVELSIKEGISEDKQIEDKPDNKDLDSIDSGIGTDVDAKMKKFDDVEKTATSLEPETLKTESKAEKTVEQPPKPPVADKPHQKSPEPETPKKDSIPGPSSTAGTSLSPSKTPTDDLHLSGKSTPDIAEVERMKLQDATQAKHIPGSSTPPTVPVKEISTTQAEETKAPSPIPPKTSTITALKDSDIRSCTPGSDDLEIGASTYSDISSGQVSRAPHLLESERIESDDEDDVPGSPLSVTSQVAHSRSSSRYDFDDERLGTKMDPMNTSFYGALPDETEPELNFEKAMVEHRQTRGEDLDSSSYLYEITQAKFSSGTPEPDTFPEQTQLDQINKNEASNLMTASFMGDLPSATTTTTSTTETKKDAFDSWGKPLGLPSPAPPNDNRGTPKKERKLPSNVSAKNKLNDDKKRSESPSKYKNKKLIPVYVDLTYVPHHGNAYYSYVDFFKRVRARYYVFSGIEPSREVYNALLEAKQTWEDKELEVTIIPTYDTDILGYWVAENEELLTKYKIDLSPSASRCTINLQDHETSCSAYRLEF